VIGVADFVVWFKDLWKDSVAIAGGKGANLGEMTNAKFSVPPGFVITAQTYERFIVETEIKGKILSLLDGLDVEDTTKLQDVAEAVQNLIIGTEIPEELKEVIAESYALVGVGDRSGAHQLVEGTQEFVAVRSSATAEDLPDASFAGQQATYLNVKGKNDVIEAVRKCWASLFTARAIYYREKNNFRHEDVLIAVIVQKMVNSDKAGVLFTVNPATNNLGEIIIEGAFGLGEAVVSGAVTPDFYCVDKETLDIKQAEKKEQKFKIVRDVNTGKSVEKELAPDEKRLQVLSEREIIDLARIGKNIEEHYGHPQDIEWAVEGDKIYIVQSRAVTTLKSKDAGAGHIEGNVLLRGETASSGAASGPVRIVPDARDLDKIKVGDILVTMMTNPDMVPGMKRAAAVVTDEGGMTSHAAIVSREMGIPCIVGTENATKVLKDNQVVTVHATKGLVYEGEFVVNEEKKQLDYADPVTKTAVKVMLDFPDRAQEVADQTNADGVGLLRLEFLIAGGSVHPAQYIRDGKGEEYVAFLVKEIEKVAVAFSGKPVWVRNSDLRSDEYRNLRGGEREPEESDPMIGWHGVRRLLDEPQILKAEFLAVKKLHEKGHSNIGIMVPFVINVEEVKRVKEYLSDVGLEPGKDVAFGIMVETPAACWVIEEICEEGVDFVSFGTNDLTQLTLGIDRNNERIQKHFDEMHPAVLGEMSKVIQTCRKYGVETSICGQAASRPEMAAFLVEQGIDSVSPNPDAVHEIRKVVAEAEKLKCR
jgi:pyruvate, water dikinase